MNIKTDEIRINCFCGKQFVKRIIGEGSFGCPYCAKKYIRIYNAKENGYEFEVEEI